MNRTAATARTGRPMSAAASQDAGTILSVRRLRKFFPVHNFFGRTVGHVKALDDVSFDLRRGEILGVVGESGCGKSTLGKTLIGIYGATDGEILFRGEDIAGLSRRAFRRVRGQLQYVYQDPGASLDPRWKIGSSLAEPLVIHRPDMGPAERRREIEAAIRSVGLPASHLDLYPHELSGGQQRRVGLARVLTLHPSVIILDEPTSGLDVSVQATVLKLFLDLKREFDLTYIFISHDLAVVQMMCHRVAVMYLGRVVEIGDTRDVFDDPKHPYTRSLLAAIPKPGGKRITEDFWLEGEPPDPANLPSGCRFRTRCPLAQPRCAREAPEPRPFDGGRLVECHFA